MPDVSEEEEVAARNMRAKQPWVRYDSVVIGPGATQLGRGTWFDNWAQFAAADNLTFNDGSRTRTVGVEYCNQSGDTEDWRQDIVETRIEFFSPPGLFGNETDALDNGIFQSIFAQEFPRRIWAEVRLGDTDTYLEVPCVMLPSNLGVENSVQGLGGLPVTVGGHTGQADFRTGWQWPRALKIPAKSKIFVTLRIGRPLRQLLQGIPAAPGSSLFNVIGENGEPTTVAMPNFYTIRVSHWGPRYLQLRGALSA